MFVYLFIMSSRSFTLFINPNLSVRQMNQYLKTELIRGGEMNQLLIPFRQTRGRQIRVVVYNLNVFIVDSDIRHHVLQTTISAFQNHRLSAIPNIGTNVVPNTAVPELNGTTRCPSRQKTGKSCSICLEDIYSNDLQCLPCAHLFHKTCIRRWIMQTPECPECRFVLT